MHTKSISVGAGKTNKWITSTKGGNKKINLTIILRNKLGLADNVKEVKTIIRNRLIHLNGKVVTDPRIGIGLMDILSIPKIKKDYRLMPKGEKLEVVEIPAKEAKTRLLKITSKKIIAGDRTQLTLHDGSTMLYDKDCNVLDTLIVTVPGNEVKKIVHLKKGAQVLVYEGRHSGLTGELKETIEGTQARKSISKVADTQTLTEYLFAIGEKSAEIKI